MADSVLCSACSNHFQGKQRTLFPFCAVKLFILCREDFFFTAQKKIFTAQNQ